MMNAARIEEIQKACAYPESHSVAMALCQVWNECSQEHAKREAKIQELEAAFDDQTRELETAVSLLEELGAEHALEFRRRAYPNLYTRN